MVLLQVEFKQTDCKYQSSIAWEVKHEELTQEVRIPDEFPDAGRMVGCRAQVIIRSKEWQGGSACVSGGVMAWALYLPEDGSQLQCVNSYLPFRVKWDLPERGMEGAIHAIAQLRFADARILSPRKMMIRVGVAVLGDIICPAETALYQPDNVPEDVQLLEKAYPMLLTRETGEKYFQLDEELEPPTPAPAQILYYTLGPEFTEVRVMADKALFRGNEKIHLVYQTDDGKLRTWDYEIPFSQFQELDGTYEPEAVLRCDGAVTGLELEQEEQCLRLKGGVVLQYVIEAPELIHITEDAYSVSRDAVPQMAPLKLPAVLDEGTELVEVTAPMEAGLAQVVDMMVLPEFPTQHRKEEKICWTISGTLQILGYGEDGVPMSVTAGWQEERAMKAAENCTVYGLATPDGDAHWEGGRTCSCGMRLTTRTISDGEIPMVSGLTLTPAEEPDPDRPSLILRRWEGELWTLAKSCRSTVTDIRLANGLEQDPEPGQMLLIPVIF